MLYADVENTAMMNHDKKGILAYKPNFESPNIHAKKCFKDYYPEENIELATPNKYSSDWNINSCLKLNFIYSRGGL